MAKSKTLLSTYFIPLTVTFLFSLVTASYYQSISPTHLGFSEEKLTHLHFYFHDVVTGPNPTVVLSAESPLKGKSESPLPFGSLMVLEDPLTEGPDPQSKLVGKAQGFYTSASQKAVLDLEIVMAMTFAFTEGKYNGSTFSVLGRNTIFAPVRELPIIGGTGAFRFARGFVRAKTHQVDYHLGDAIVEYNVYVFHYATSPPSQEVFSEGLEFMVDPLLGKI